MLELDKQILLWINGHHHPLLDAILIPVSYAGECGTIWILVCLLLLIFGKAEHRKTALILIITLLIVDRLIAAQMGEWTHRTRPYLALEGVRQIGIRWTSSSFPSGHAHSVWIVTILLGTQWRRFLPYLVTFALLTCYSRPYLGMHYPGDVLVGSVLGIAAGLSVLGIKRLWKRMKDKQ